MLYRILRLIFWHILLLCLASNAQTATQVTVPLWINDKDNPMVTTRGCVQDNDGFLWIATEMGLYRYDGLKLEKVIHPKYPNIQIERIKQITKDVRSGEVLFDTYPSRKWFSIKKGVISRFDASKGDKVVMRDNVYSHITVNKKLRKTLEDFPVPKVDIAFIKNNISFDAQQFFTVGKYLYVRYVNTIKIINTTELNDSEDLYIKKNGLFFRIGDKLFVSANGSIYELRGTTLLKNKPVTTDGRLQSFLLRSLKNDTGNDRFIHGYKDDYYLFSDGSVYVVEYVNNRLQTRFVAFTGIADINSIYHDHDRGIYFMNTITAGILMVKETGFKTLRFSDYKLDINYSVAKIDMHSLYSASGWRYDLETGYLEEDKYFKNSNRSFLMKYNSKFYRQDTTVLRNIDNSDILWDNNDGGHWAEMTGYCMHGGMLWVSTRHPDRPVMYLRNGKTEIDIFLANALKGICVTGLFSWKNKIVITTEKGVYEYSPFLQRINAVQGLESVYARRIVRNDEGSYWVCCYGQGLYLVSGGKAWHVKGRNAAITTTHAVETDRLGNMWISTNEGLLSGVKSAVIQNTLEGKAVDLYRFTTQEGLVTNEFNGGGTHPSVNDGHIIGFPNMKGFLWFHPSELKKQAFSEDIIIDRVLCEGEAIMPGKAGYTITSNAGIIEVDFAYAYYFNRDNLTIEYRLEKQGRWQKITGNNFSFARTCGGMEKLYIRIITHGTGKSVTREFDFQFESRYYETAWFWLGILLFALLAAYFFFRMGLKIHKSREEALKEKVAEKTRELRYAIEQLTASRAEISKSLIEKETLLKEIHHRVKNNLQLVISLLNIQSRRHNNSIEEFLSKGRDRIMAMVLIHQHLYQSQSIEYVSAKSYIENLTLSILKSHSGSTDITINVDAPDIEMNLETAIPMGLIVNEFVSNSMKHGFPDKNTGEITICLDTMNDKMRLKMQDNGVGFDPGTTKAKTFGLELIKIMSTQLNAKLSVNSVGHTKFVLVF
ncbi:histidine kinase dimerization/phosphoacceptor domain -containing protein [Flavobacterium sp. DGU11]|uniref:histidine kinase n=1 Tax=Flavobacterium arundinis TaxID=3139143 RepID=A0ABU9I162_9FLAO